MTTNNKCNHALEIAKDMYETYAIGKSLAKHQPWALWEDLPDDSKAGWLAVANQALPTIADHALEDVKDYLGIKASGASGWRKALYWAGGIILAGILAGGAVTVSGCGHSVDVTQEQTTICKDGSCLVIEPGHLSYSQAQPKTDVPPIVQQKGK